MICAMTTQKQQDSKERKRKEFLEVLSILWAPLIHRSCTNKTFTGTILYYSMSNKYFIHVEV